MFPWKITEMFIIDCCCVFISSEELVEHLLLHCTTAMQLWAMVFSLFGVHMLMT